MSSSGDFTPFTGLSLMPEDDFRRAAYPLFESGEVEILEWSFDIGWGPQGTPDWIGALLDFYSQNNRLLGHGVTFSPLSAQWTPRQEWWLDRFQDELATRNYQHVSEHFGFMSAGTFHDSAPLPVPLTDETLGVGQDRLQRLADLTSKPVGLENLAFAFGRRDVEEQGKFLDQLLQPIDGFLLLDLHNIYCQVCNFGVDAQDLLESYPLHRVRELHISGGSWSESSLPDTSPIRRDTHDNAVPEELWTLLELALQQCPGVKAVIFERLGGTLMDEAQAEQFRTDFLKTKSIVHSGAGASS